MISYDAKLDIDEVLARCQKLPAGLDAVMGFALDRIGIEGARRARAEAPKRFSTLTEGIRWVRPDASTVAIVSSARYAAYVEAGTGPAIGKPAYMPNPVHLYAYVKSTARVSFRNTRAGSRARGAQLDEIRDRAWALALYIQRHGTRPNPYMARTQAYMEQRAPEIVERELARAAAGVSS